MTRRSPAVREDFVRLEGQEYAAWWSERYGVQRDAFRGLAFFRRGRSTVWVASESVRVGDTSPVDGVGLPFIRTSGRVWKPTSVAAIQFGTMATRNIVEVTPLEAQQLLRRSAVRFVPGDPRRDLALRGYVIARLCGVPLGCVLWRQGELETCIPKGNVVVGPRVIPPLS